MTFGNLPSALRQTAQASPLKDADQHGQSPGPEAGSSSPAGAQSANRNQEAVLPPPFGQLNDRGELLASFSADASSMSRPRSRSLGSDQHSYPPSSDLSSRVMEAAQSMAALPQLRHSQPMAAYPSPNASAFDTPARASGAPSFNATSKVMPPPNSVSSPTRSTEYDPSPERSAKRVRLSPRDQLYQSHDGSRLQRASSHSPGALYELPKPLLQPLTQYLISSRVNNPMTPASSLTNSDEARQTSGPASNSYTIKDAHLRRVSVSSLLSRSPELEQSRMIWSINTHSYNDSTVLSPLLLSDSPPRQRAYPNTQTESYGLDQGLPDLDIPKNNDTAAINGLSPSQHSDLDAWLEGVDLGVPEFGFGLQKREFVFAKGGYYASPVPINIPRKLEPLPSTLLENPMNLLYFHHFLNHTARILVVHDCSQNPFRTILPQSKLFHDSDLFTAG